MRLRYSRLVVSAIILALCVLVAFPAVALAIAEPDAPPQITAVYVYDNLRETGDVGILIDYFLDYTTSGNPPTGETANESFLGIFVDIDGITQLKAVAPYAFDDLGYGRGLIWIYFTAAEVTAHTIDRANIALYEVWLSGNPTLGWVPGPDPPKTIAGIDYWQPVGTSTSTLFALRVLSLAQVLGTAWTEDLIQETASGSRLTAMGEDYFMVTIPFLRDIAPTVFAAGTTDPVQEDIDYSTSFGATITDGTGTQPASPLTLVEGANTVDITGTGTFLVELEKGTVGVAEDIVGGATVTGSPVDLVWGTATITVTLGGTNDFLCTVNLLNTQTTITDTVTGTAFDLEPLATRFGISTMMLSGIAWAIISVIICAGVYKISDMRGGLSGGGGGKVIMLVFTICLVIGAVLGMLPVIAIVLLFIGDIALIGYVVFFRAASF